MISNVGKIRIKSFNDLFLEPKIQSLENQRRSKNSEPIQENDESPDSGIFTTSVPQQKKRIKIVKPVKKKNLKIPKNQLKINDFFAQENLSTKACFVRSGLSKEYNTNAIQENISQDLYRLQNVQIETIESRLNPEIIDLCSDCENETKKENSCGFIEKSTAPKAKKQKRQCPPYKIIKGTPFAVDAFQFGIIEGIKVYFLTHFHADHYIGLTKSFQKPIYLSGITSRLVKKFIGTNEKYLHEIDLNQTIIIEDVEITAIDANHCPGAIMLHFKMKTGECILHTGDFRANPDMESEPLFWNNHIDTIYLDTTYISTKYSFQSQWESVLCAEEVIKKFQKKYQHQKILYVCGSYLIGKERFWVEIAKKFGLNVWVEEKRRNALEAIGNDEILKLLRKNPNSCNLHVIPIGKLNYQELCIYFERFKENFDTLLALRASGWEKNSRPQYRGNINIVGIDYSEHSSYEELKRFVKFIKPNNVISTVPVQRDLNITHKVPLKWYKYDKLYTERNLQPLITTYLKQKKKLTNSFVPSNSLQSSYGSIDASSDWMT